MRSRRTDRPRERGTTLLELLVVFLIISLAMGIGVGVFGKFSLVNAANNSAAGVRSLVRVIRDWARTYGTVGTVIVDTKENRIVGLLERVVGQWHLEPDGDNARSVSAGAFDMPVSFSGGVEADPNGCIGGCVRLDGGPGSLVDLGHSVTFESEWGVSVSADVFLEERRAGVIVQKGESFGLGVGASGELVGFVGVGEGGTESALFRVAADSGDELVPLGKWVRVGLYYDRVEVRVFIDYRPVGAAQERRALGRSDEALTIGATSGGIRGKVDGLRLGVLGPGDGGDLGSDVKLRGGTPVIRFNADGALDPRYHNQPAQILLESEAGRRVKITVGQLGHVKVIE